MAVDDVTTVMASLVQGATTTRQPSAGVEELVLGAGGPDGGTAPNDCPFISVAAYDGTLQGIYWGYGAGGSSATAWFQGKLMIDNTNYLRVIQQKSGTLAVAYSVIQVG